MVSSDSLSAEYIWRASRQRLARKQYYEKRNKGRKSVRGDH
jgi:hypothetical protein